MNQSGVNSASVQCYLTKAFSLFLKLHLMPTVKKNCGLHKPAIALCPRSTGGLIRGHELQCVCPAFTLIGLSYELSLGCRCCTDNLASLSLSLRPGKLPEDSEQCV